MTKNEIKVGDMIRFGHFKPQAGSSDEMDLIWRILDVSDDSALLLSDKLIADLPYNKTEGEITWKYCTLRQWLNIDFRAAAFSPTESVSLIESPTGEGSDIVFILSRDEIEKYLSDEVKRNDNNGGLMQKLDRVAQPLGVAQTRRKRPVRNEYWWVRDVTYQDARFGSMLEHIDTGGYYGRTPSYCERWVRPACRVKLSALLPSMLVR